jgi:hypothetical protein
VVPVCKYCDAFHKQYQKVKFHTVVINYHNTSKLCSFGGKLAFCNWLKTYGMLYHL